MAKKAKELTVTTQFSKFRELCKKLRGFNDLLIKLPNNILILDHNKSEDNSLPTENFGIWKDEESGMFYNWAVVDPKHFHTEMTEKNVKIKGTEVSSDEASFRVYKEGKLVYTIDRLTGDMDQRMKSALNHYRRMDRYLWNYKNYQYIPIQQETVDRMAEGRPISINIPDYCTINLARSLFPLLKRPGTPMSYSVVEHDVDNAKVFLLFREEYEMFDLYTLVACISVSIPPQNESDDHEEMD